MARSTEEIYNQIIAEKESFAELNTLLPAAGVDFQSLLLDLTSNSKVAIWRLWAFVSAVTIFLLENLWDVAKAEIKQQAEATVTGTPIWWRNEALLFQLGDDLVFDGKKFVYQIIDPSKQIIKQAAVIEVGRQIRIKVVKANSIPLTTAELQAFSGYVQEKRFAGTDVAQISLIADLLKTFHNIIYDPLVLQADGALISDTAIFPVEDAINNFLLNLEFNGELVLNNLTDAIQLAEGVIDPIFQNAEARFGGLPFTPIIDSYLTNGGHIVIDEINFPLSATLTYTADV